MKYYFFGKKYINLLGVHSFCVYQMDDFLTSLKYFLNHSEIINFSGRKSKFLETVSNRREMFQLKEYECRDNIFK